MIFSFVRSTQRVVSKYINEFLNDMSTDDLDRQRSVDKVLAGKLFQIAGWGTISVSFMTSLVYVLQYLMMMSFILISDTSLIPSVSLTELRPLVVPLFILIQVFTILPSILYCIFLIILWLYFRDRTKVKYSGYSSDDPEILNRVHRPNPNELSNQDEFHYTYYKRKYKVMYTTYVLCIVVISLLFAGFFAPVLEKKWEWNINLQPGDYHLLNASILKNGCLYNDDNQVEIQVGNNSLDSSVDFHCNESILAGKIIPDETHYVTIAYGNVSNVYNLIVWLQNNSVIFQQINSTKYIDSSSIPSILVESHFPCYYPRNLPSLGYFEHIFFEELGEDSCKEAMSISDSEKSIYQPHCNSDTRESGELNCTVRYNGLYLIDTFQHFLTNVTVTKFGCSFNESNAIPLDGMKGEQLHEYDIIVFNSTMNTTNYFSFCSIRATCRFHIAFRILMPFLILPSSMFLLTICLILIHKI